MNQETLSLLTRIEKKLDHLISQRDINTLDITSESALIESSGGDVMEALFEKSRAYTKNRRRSRNRGQK
jgi:hypothetical protein